MDEILSVLRTTPEVIRALVYPLEDPDWDWKPGNDQWSISEVLNHLRHVEKENFLSRVRSIREEDLPILPDYDQTAEHEKGSYSEPSGMESLVRFEEIRVESVRYLQDIQPDDLDREGEHPGVERVSISEILNLWAFHDLRHVRQISTLVAECCFREGLGRMHVYYPAE